MASQQTDQRRIIAYLLGELTEDERARLEDAYFADDATYEEFEAVETDLVDAYVRRELSAEARARFETRCRESARLRERVAFARQLARRPAELQPGQRVAVRRWWQFLPAFELRPRPALAAGLAVAVLMVAVSVAWQWSRPGLSRDDTQAQHQEPTTPAPRESVAPVGAFALVLLPGSLRAPDESATLVVPAGAPSVRIKVVHEGSAFPEYRVVLQTPEGRDVWRTSGLKPAGPGERAVAIDVPARLLPVGDYTLTLGGGTPGAPMADIADYAFRVIRQ